LAVVKWIVSLALAVVFTDFLSGILHWLEDSYGHPGTPVLGRYVTQANIKHHFEPRHFTKSPVWKRNRVTWTMTALLMLGVWYSGHFSPFWAWVGVLGVLSNEIHCWAHRTPRENGPVVTALQRWHIVQSPRHHAVHHTDPKKECYCVLTDFLNPVLDRIRFFRRTEALIALRTGVHPRKDDSVLATR